MIEDLKWILGIRAAKLILLRSFIMVEILMIVAVVWSVSGDWGFFSFIELSVMFLSSLFFGCFVSLLFLATAVKKMLQSLMDRREFELLDDEQQRIKLSKAIRDII